MNSTAFKSRTLLLIAALAFLVISFIRGGDAVTDILKSAGYLVGIVTLVLGIMRLNKEIKQERQIVP